MEKCDNETNGRTLEHMDGMGGLKEGLIFSDDRDPEDTPTQLSQMGLRNIMEMSCNRCSASM